MLVVASLPVDFIGCMLVASVASLVENPLQELRLQIRCPLPRPVNDGSCRCSNLLERNREDALA
jgi:hypothetical protein